MYTMNLPVNTTGYLSVNCWNMIHSRLLINITVRLLGLSIDVKKKKKKKTCLTIGITKYMKDCIIDLASVNTVRWGDEIINTSLTQHTNPPRCTKAGLWVRQWPGPGVWPGMWLSPSLLTTEWIEENGDPPNCVTLTPTPQPSRSK